MAEKQFIHLDDVVKMTKPAAFSILIKPVGSACNFDCSYCYYLDKASLYNRQEPQMSDELLELCIKQYIEAQGVPSATFCWHGGEPLLAGLDFFKKAVQLQQKYKGEKQIENSLQTNGALINKEWCDFFRENNFLIGISIDGPADVHDAFRKDRGGRPTFDRVMKAIEMMAANGVEYNTLSTVNAQCEGRGKEIYHFMRSISRFMQFLPVVEHVVQPEGATRPHIVSPDTPQSQLAPWSVSAKGYGQFMCDIFDEWVVNDVGRYFVQLFDVSLAQWCGVAPPLCAFGETCGDGPAIEHNGDVYACDHYVYPEYRLGNIREKSLKVMQQSQQLLDFGTDKRDTLPMECKRCGYRFACRGECPKHRFDTTKRGEPGLNSLCAGYKQFFIHVDPYMRYMRTLLEKKLPPSDIIPWARERLRK